MMKSSYQIISTTSCKVTSLCHNCCSYNSIATEYEICSTTQIVTCASTPDAVQPVENNAASEL